MSTVARAYCERFDISRISLEMQPGVVEHAEPVCHLELKFHPGYQVQFKLQGERALLGERIATIDADGKVIAAGGADTGDLEADLEQFFKHIESRLIRIAHEERVQSITFLGNTFVLDNKTVFDVVEDVGGQLTIEMHRGAQRQSAKLLASSLLDGLYDGSIVLQED